MARNEHDGRSLEERLASLDAMSEESAGEKAEETAAGPPAPAAEGDQGGEEASPAGPQNGPPDEAVQQPPVDEPDPEPEPWLAAPPSFQQPPETGFAPEAFGPPQPPYDGGPMPQPFDGGMLPPPYAGGHDPSQPSQPQPSPYDTDGDAAPPLEQLPPYLGDQQDPGAAGPQYQPIDPATGQPFPQDTDASGRPYVPIDPETGRPLSQDQTGQDQSGQEQSGQEQSGQEQSGQGESGQGESADNQTVHDLTVQDPNAQDPNAQGQQYAPVDPNTGQPYAYDPSAAGEYPQADPTRVQSYGQPYQDPNAAIPQYQPPVDPSTGQPYAQDPNAAVPQYQPPVDPNTGQPYAYDPNAAGQQPYPQVDPATGQPYGQQPYQDPNAGQPYGQDPNAAIPQYQPPVDPNTGQPYAQDPNAAGQQPYPQVDPNTGQPYAYDPNAAGQQPYQDPNGGQPYGQDPNAAVPQYQPPVDPNTGQPYAQDPNAAGQQPYPPVDPNTGQLVQGYAYPAGPPQGQPGYPPALNQMLQPPPGYTQPPQPPHPQQGQHPPQPPTADSLSSENLLGERRIAPSSGWRRAVYKATAGSIHPGESQTELRRKDLIARARNVVAGGHHRVAVMSLKGGVGKTTTTTGLGSMLASLRGDRVIAVDANPDRGTLSDKVRLETAATVRDLLNNREKIQRYADVRAFTSQNEARLEILASDRDPAVSEAFSADDYAAVAVVLEQYYSICITDCGTGLLHSAMAGVLSLADQLVLVSSPSVDGARSASATLDWLEAHDHGHLVRNGVVVLSMVRNRTRSQVDLDKLQTHFESRCRAVVRVPYDDHLEEGAEVELEQLAPATREAYLNLAAVVGDGFALPRPTEE